MTRVKPSHALADRRSARRPGADARASSCQRTPMKASQFFISTLKEAPADAEVVSHQLMMRAGMIKRLGAGIYTYMPMGLRVIRKVEAIVREEMNRAGAVELLMPVVQPAELWQETGRWDKMGPELMRVKDRHDRDFVIQPTSEEVITDIARQELRSYRAAAEEFLSHPDQVPRRAPAALRRDARARVHDEGRLLASTATSTRRARSYDAHVRRLRAHLRPLRPDVSRRRRRQRRDRRRSGSHEFQVIADTGEDAIVYCPDIRLRGQHRAGRGAARRPRRARAPTQAAGEDADARQEHLRGRRRAARPAAGADGEVARAGHRRADERRRRREPTIWLLLLRGDHDTERDQGRQGARASSAASASRPWPRSIDTSAASPGYLGPIGTEAAGARSWPTARSRR